MTGDSAEVKRWLELPRPIVVDLDGTLWKGRWPHVGDWQPGAIEAMRAFHEEGFEILVHSCRLSPLMPDHQTHRNPADVEAQVRQVRDELDKAGLPYVRIFSGVGKPSGCVYIDDKAERYQGRPGSWAKLVEKVLAREGRAPDDE